MKEEIKWHPAFYGGIELELRKYREWLEFEEEHELSKEPLHMDMLIIKKVSDSGYKRIGAGMSQCT